MTNFLCFYFPSTKARFISQKLYAFLSAYWIAGNILSKYVYIQSRKRHTVGDEKKGGKSYEIESYCLNILICDDSWKEKKTKLNQ